MMDHDRLVDLLIEAGTMKQVPRMGWAMRGVPRVESVAEHSFGVALVALTLAGMLEDSDLDTEKVLVMALLHDLAEVRLTDLPVSAARLIPRGVKRQAEASAMADLLAPLPAAGRLKALWQEFEDQTSPEGRLVRDADKLEMMVQCLRYEWAGSLGLDEYWHNMDRREWHFGLCARLYARLKARRVGNSD
jgi:putative hydrolase of HD superfamily